MSQYYAKVTGTGAAITKNIGFVPSYVKVSSTVGELEWVTGMDQASALKRLAGVDADAGHYTPSIITSDGISTVNNGTNMGFIIGADEVNASEAALEVLALR